MSNLDDASESEGGETASADESAPGSKEERLATLLLRLLGVYFLASAIVIAPGHIIHFVSAARTLGLDDALPAQGLYLAQVAVEFAIGAYFFVGGRWVVTKILLPLVHSPAEEDFEDADENASEDVVERDDDSSTQAG